MKTVHRQIVAQLIVGSNYFVLHSKICIEIGITVGIHEKAGIPAVEGAKALMLLGEVRDGAAVQVRVADWVK